MQIKLIWYIKCRHRHHEGNGAQVADSGKVGITKKEFIQHLLKAGWKFRQKEGYNCPECRVDTCKKCKELREAQIISNTRRSAEVRKKKMNKYTEPKKEK